jgi:hypothetical protein
MLRVDGLKRVGQKRKVGTRTQRELTREDLNAVILGTAGTRAGSVLN